MPVELYVDHERRAVHSVWRGIVPSAELLPTMRAALALGEAEGIWDFLTDCRELEGGHTAVDLFFAVEALASLGIAPRVREALVVPLASPMAREAQFYEDACVNRGLRIRLFTGVEEAAAWLASARAAWDRMEPPRESEPEPLVSSGVPDLGPRRI